MAAVERLCREISALTARCQALWPVDEQIGRINRKLRGWSNYFSIGTVSKAYRAVNAHAAFRVRQWLRVKFKVRGPIKTRFPDRYLYQELGLCQLQRKSRVPVSWAKV